MQRNELKPPYLAPQAVVIALRTPANRTHPSRRTYAQDTRTNAQKDSEEGHSENLTLPVAFPGSPGGQGGAGGGGLFSITKLPLFDAALTTFIGLGIG